MNSVLIGVIWWGPALLAMVDAFRRPAESWVYADRERSTWVILMFFLGPITSLIYLISIVPRFPRRSHRAASAFQKD